MRLAILEGGLKLCHPLARVCLGTGKKWHNIWKQHDRGGGAIFADRGSEEKDWPGSMIGVLPRGRGRPRDATYPKSTLLPAVSRGDAACPPTHGPLPRAATAGGVATGPRSFMRSGMEAMISSRSLLPPTLWVCRRDRGEHEELWPPPWSPHRRDGARRRPTACGDHCCSSGRVVTGSCRCVPPRRPPLRPVGWHGSCYYCPQLLCLELDGQPPWIPQLEGHVNQPSSHAVAARR